jgi:peptidoglycan hydrolase-like protein with peptidoglycan-binding domain
MRILGRRYVRPLAAAIVLLLPAASVIALNDPAEAATCNSNAYGSWADNCIVLNGSEGGLVIGVQQYIDTWGCGGYITIDGDFGEATYDAVKCYQGDNSLQVDGDVGPQTWTSMYDDLTYTTEGTTWKYYGVGPDPTHSPFRELLSSGEWEVRNGADDWVQM